MPCYKIFTCTLALWILCSANARAQDSLSWPKRNNLEMTRYFSLVTGYQFGKRHFAELGVAVNEYGRKGWHPIAKAYYISSEIKFDNKLLIGPKVGCWFGGGLALGASLIYYTDFSAAALRLRPEIGSGFQNWRIVYGYNIPLTNRGFQGINKSHVSIVFMFGLKKLKTIRK